jgi:hypothetical protein
MSPIAVLVFQNSNSQAERVRRGIVTVENHSNCIFAQRSRIVFVNWLQNLVDLKGRGTFILIVGQVDPETIDKRQKIVPFWLLLFSVSEKTLRNRSSRNVKELFQRSYKFQVTSRFFKTYDNHPS